MDGPTACKHPRDGKLSLRSEKQENKTGWNCKNLHEEIKLRSNSTIELSPKRTSTIELSQNWTSSS